jgi:hypothetical protein
MENDPYASPLMNVQPTGRTGHAAISQGVIQQLAGTKGWVRFISVLMFVGAGFMLLIGLAMLLMGNAMASATKNPMFSGGMGVFMAVTYGIIAFVYIFPALKLWKYATCIGNLMSSGAALDLEMALNEQRSFWKFIGILFLIFLSLYAVFFIGLALVGGMGAMSARNSG